MRKGRKKGRKEKTKKGRKKREERGRGGGIKAARQDEMTEKLHDINSASISTMGLSTNATRSSQLHDSGNSLSA